jgi:hypothetical protein
MTPKIYWFVIMLLNTLVPGQPNSQQNSSRSKSFSLRQQLVPATLIVYGVVSVKNEALQDGNETVKEHIWNDNPHKLFPLPNYLQFAPAAAVYAQNFSGIRETQFYRPDFYLCYYRNDGNGGSIWRQKISMEWRPGSSARSSFPSGHTATAFATAEFLALEYAGVSKWYDVAGYSAAWQPVF